MRQVLAASKVEVGEYVEKYGKFYLTRWRELGDGPAIQFYNEAITTAPGPPLLRSRTEDCRLTGR